MTSFHFDIGARARNAGRFIAHVRNELLRALTERKKETKLSQQTLAHKLGVHRSLINRQLTGETNMTLRSLADLAWAMDLEISVELKKLADVEAGKNQASTTSTVRSAPVRVLSGVRNRAGPVVANSDRGETTRQTKSA